MRQAIAYVLFFFLAFSALAKIKKADPLVHYSVCVQGDLGERCSTKQFSLPDAWAIAQMFLEAPIGSVYNVGVYDNTTKKMIPPPADLKSVEPAHTPPSEDIPGDSKI